jgi:hypothetical protein
MCSKKTIIYGDIPIAEKTHGVMPFSSDGVEYNSHIGEKSQQLLHESLSFRRIMMRQHRIRFILVITGFFSR